jgi:DNA-binding winged helix-turn-helix (wHTH) protein
MPNSVHESSVVTATVFAEGFQPDPPRAIISEEPECARNAPEETACDSEPRCHETQTELASANRVAFLGSATALASVSSSCAKRLESWAIKSTLRTTRMNDRRSWSQDVLSFGPFDLFGRERLLKKAEEPIPLGDRALDILITLAERAGEVVTHKELIERVWPDVNVDETNLRVHISALRKALGDGRDGARYISSVAGRGYCFVAPGSPGTHQVRPLLRAAGPAGVHPQGRWSRIPSAPWPSNLRGQGRTKGGCHGAGGHL